MKKIFITGAEGFVGQHIINLLKPNYFIIGLSRNTTIPSENNVDYVLGDILDTHKIQDLLEKYQPDVILHLAGIAKTWNNDPKDVFNINLFGTLNIYEAILKVKQEHNFDPKIIFISSAEAYGQTSDSKNIDENSLLCPINQYGSSKTAADRLSYQYSQSEHLKITILRPFPHIGPGQRQGFFVPDMASQIVDIEKDPQKHELLVGNLQAVRDYLDVRDVAEAYKLVIENDFAPGEVFNICSGIGVKIEDLLNQLLSLTSKEIYTKEDPARLRSIDLPTFVGNNKKFTKKTGWKPQYTLDQTLQDIMEFWRSLKK